ncbi:hypothetical protein GUJ93_ZPchr0004g40381 [Zizania palustris]|uniref:WIYLD domain-containing protein n=1 Tax=Zizania palustris TaxID=103762 RepID=A0A8J5S2V1_ZIZPA|nr:hypothetical protein GUJ93_ZPchr0004g40381 [Zizania palustris]
MKQLGFSKKESTPVLRSLYKLFRGNWEPIEDECYRALADAILDRRQESATPADDGDQDQELRGCMPDDDHRQPLTSLVVCGGSCDTDNETDEPLTNRPRFNSTNLATHQTVTSLGTKSPPSVADGQDATVAISAHGASPQSTHLQTRASTPLRQASSVTAHKRPRQMMDEDFQHAAFLREPKPDPDIDALQDSTVTSHCSNPQLGLVDHPPNANSSRVALPLALPLPDQNVPQISG